MKAKLNYHDLVRHDALAMLPERVGRVLDFGGGIGATAAALRDTGRADHVVLFDQVADNALPAIDAAEALDFEDVGAVAGLVRKHGPFDTVLALDVLEHLRDPWAVAEALGEGVRPGGRLLVSVPNVASLAVLGPLLLKDDFAYVDAGVMDRTHLRWFTRRTAAALAQGRGLRVERVAHNPFTRKYALANTLTLGLAKRFLAKQWLTLAVKPG